MIYKLLEQKKKRKKLVSFITHDTFEIYDTTYFPWRLAGSLYLPSLPRYYYSRSIVRVRGYDNLGPVISKEHDVQLELLDTSQRIVHPKDSFKKQHALLTRDNLVLSLRARQRRNCKRGHQSGWLALVVV